MISKILAWVVLSPFLLIVVPVSIVVIWAIDTLVGDEG